LWTFRRLIDEYINRKTDAEKGNFVLRASSSKEIKDRLRDRPESAVILDRFVKELRLEDLEGVRDRIQESGSGPSAHAKFVDLAKRVLRWGLRHRRLEVGLEPTGGKKGRRQAVAMRAMSQTPGVSQLAVRSRTTI
jgi:hypothetical protein